ncbi:MAG: hypothetical protein Q8M92_08225, partial [Candidatus Subteraquimicrobiales bacterium]|nr:hypothetical protein [Candidatus Subteraquimicrobiales bacterium]
MSDKRDYKQITSFMLEEWRRDEVMDHVNKIINLVTEPYADIIDAIFDIKFTPRHAILLSALLRHVECRD